MDKKKIDKKAVGKRIFNIRNSLNLTLEQFGKLDNLNAKKILYGLGKNVFVYLIKKD